MLIDNFLFFVLVSAHWQTCVALMPNCRFAAPLKKGNLHFLLFHIHVDAIGRLFFFFQKEAVPAFFFYRNWLFTFFKLQKVKS
jgi:hypothetical protein